MKIKWAITSNKTLYSSYAQALACAHTHFHIDVYIGLQANAKKSSTYIERNGIAQDILKTRKNFYKREIQHDMITRREPIWYKNDIMSTY